MIIDCGECTARPAACHECVVTFLTAADRPVPREIGVQHVDLDEAERAAIGVLARSGLVPPLRMASTG